MTESLCLFNVLFTIDVAVEDNDNFLLRSDTDKALTILQGI